MTLVWADPFDQYGGDVDAMRSAAYLNVSADWSLSAAKPRTGSRALLFNSDDSGASDTSINALGSFRRTFGAALQEAGAGYALWIERLPAYEVGTFPALPSTAWIATKLFVFLSGGGETQVMITLGTDGAVVAYRGYVFASFPAGDGWTLLGRSAPCVRAQAYTHIEAKVKIDPVDGAVEVRVNGATVLNLTGINTDEQLTAETSQVYTYAGSQFSDYGNFYLDDYIGWDTNGAHNNDFLGDQKLYYLAPNGDTAQADWTPSAGATSYGVVDEAPPDDADYLSLVATTGSTDLALANLPASVVAVSAVVPFMRAWKGDAGVCDVAPGVVQGATPSTPVGQPIATVPQYYEQAVEVDPVSGLPFTPAEVNSLLLRIERTA